jgi:protein involved in polysaccharide export with SLBB domain
MIKWRQTIAILIVLATVPLGAAAQTSGSSTSLANQGATLRQTTPEGAGLGAKAPSSFAERRPRYRVEPSDVLDLNFPYTSDFNQTVTVQPDGYVTLRELGDFYVQGKTTPELEAALKSAYANILHDPVVTVDLKNFQAPYFIVGGEVGHPGKYDLRENISATEAVSIAGGLTENSRHSEVLLFRRVSPDTFETKKLNLKRMLNSGNLDEDAYLKPGDMLYVPKNRIGKIRRFLPYEAVGTYFDLPLLRP